ncbi:Uncharacterised protein [Vibrio cholerae]|nr:Uncharacterised protein [Vibrio cholerae]
MITQVKAVPAERSCPIKASGVVTMLFSSEPRAITSATLAKIIRG